MQTIKEFSKKYKCNIKFKKGNLYNALYLNDLEVIRSTLSKNNILLLDDVLISNHHKKILKEEKNGKNN